jgi:hypothetical protein
MKRQVLWYAGLGSLIVGALFVSRVREGQVRASAEERSVAILPREPLDR